MAAQHSTEKDQLLDKMETLQERLEESVSRQTEGERERKREETEHGEMVRELQLYLNKERERSDKLENKVHLVYFIYFIYLFINLLLNSLKMLMFKSKRYIDRIGEDICMNPYKLEYIMSSLEQKNIRRRF